MSGTSFDGVDVAIIKTDGKNYIKKIDTNFIEYNSYEKKLYNNSILENYSKIKEIIDNKHILAIKEILKKFNKKLDVIGLHGQTFFHEPLAKWTWQYINSKIISKTFKTNVISDFRIADINHGGEGAPLVPLFHKNLLFNKNILYPVGILNIGGVSNITIIKNNYDFLGFDTGPGNGPLDSLISKRLNLNMDKNGQLANKGQVNNSVKKKTINLLIKHSKTTSYDRKHLDELCLTYINTLTTEDALATLVEIITDFICLKLKKFSLKKLIVTGGGRNNKTLMLNLKNKLKIKLLLAEDLDWDGDSLEAQAFGYFAVKSILGEALTFKSTTGVRKALSGGVLYYYRS